MLLRTSSQVTPSQAKHHTRLWFGEAFQCLKQTETDKLFDEVHEDTYIPTATRHSRTSML